MDDLDALQLYTILDLILSRPPDKADHIRPLLLFVVDSPKLTLPLLTMATPKTLETPLDALLQRGEVEAVAILLSRGVRGRDCRANAGGRPPSISKRHRRCRIEARTAEKLHAKGKEYRIPRDVKDAIRIHRMSLPRRAQPRRTSDRMEIEAQAFSGSGAPSPSLAPAAPPNETDLMDLSPDEPVEAPAARRIAGGSAGGTHSERSPSAGAPVAEPRPGKVKRKYGSDELESYDEDEAPPPASAPPAPVAATTHALPVPSPAPAPRPWSDSPGPSPTITEPTTRPSTLQPPTPAAAPPPLPPAGQSRPPVTLPDHDPPFVLRVANLSATLPLPVLQTFFEYGPDIFQSARTLKQTTRARADPQSFVRSARARPAFPALGAATLRLLRGEDGRRLLEVTYARGDDAVRAMEAFQGKKVIPKDSFCQPIQCALV